jgi:hypothetical protein
VPQGRHAHGLLSRGAQIFDELFPGLLEDFVAEGAPVISAPAELRSNLGGHLLCMTGRYADLSDTYHPSRPHLEAALRTRVQGLPNVNRVDRCQVVGVETTAGTSGSPAFRSATATTTTPWTPCSPTSWSTRPGAVGGPPSGWPGRVRASGGGEAAGHTRTATPDTPPDLTGALAAVD